MFLFFGSVSQGQRPYLLGARQKMDCPHLKVLISLGFSLGPSCGHDIDTLSMCSSSLSDQG